MAGLNQVTLIGRLGADPELRHFDNGDAVANLRMATSEKWKDKNTGEQKEQTEWHSVVLHRGQAEVAGKYLRKGSQVAIEGKLRTRKWKDRDGNDRYTTEIVGRRLHLLGGKQESQGNQSHQTQQSTADFDDDIQF